MHWEGLRELSIINSPAIAGIDYQPTIDCQPATDYQPAIDDHPAIGSPTIDYRPTINTVGWYSVAPGAVLANERLPGRRILVAADTALDCLCVSVRNKA